jgi:hypothetical protein
LIPFIIESVSDFPAFFTLDTFRARREPRRLDVRRLVEARRLPFVPFLRRVRQPFLAAAERFALEEERRFGDVFLRLVEARRLLAPRLAAELRLAALRLRVRHAFFAAADLDALVPFRERLFEDALRLPFRELRFRVAAAFLAALLRLAALLFLVAAAFLAAAERFALDGLRDLEEDFRLPFRALRFLVAAAFFAAALLLDALRFLVAAAFFADAVRDAFVLLRDFVRAAIFLAFFFEFGGFTRIRLDSAIVLSRDGTVI